MADFVEGAWGAIQDGGVIMIALAVLSLLLYRSAFGTLVFVKRTEFDLATSKDGKPIDPFILEDSIDQSRREFEELVKRQVAFIAMLAAAAPLLGLLGTVEGMLETFHSLSQRVEEETARRVSSGVSLALVTTQAGLLVAIPALFIIQLIKRESKKRQQELAHAQLLARRGELSKP